VYSPFQESEQGDYRQWHLLVNELSSGVKQGWWYFIKLTTSLLFSKPSERGAWQKG
jgi:hypothetical protein